MLIVAVAERPREMQGNKLENGSSGWKLVTEGRCPHAGSLMQVHRVNQTSVILNLLAGSKRLIKELYSTFCGVCKEPHLCIITWCDKDCKKLSSRQRRFGGWMGEVAR